MFFCHHSFLENPPPVTFINVNQRGEADSRNRFIEVEDDPVDALFPIFGWVAVLVEMGSAFDQNIYFHK